MVSFATELELCRLEGSLLSELAAHALAATANGQASPLLPSILSDQTTLRTVAQAVREGGLPAWLPAVALAIVEASPTVAVARSSAMRSRTWADMLALASERNRFATAWFGDPYLSVAHRLMGATSETATEAVSLPEPSELWNANDTQLPLDDVALRTMLARAASAELAHSWELVPGRNAFSITITPRTRVRSAVDLGATSLRAVSHAWHELGHALVGLQHGPVPRAVDESAALTTQAWLEQLLTPDLAAAAQRGRLRAVAYAQQLALEEQRIYCGTNVLPSGHVPLALIADPGAQAAYVTAASWHWDVALFDGAGILTRVKAAIA